MKNIDGSDWTPKPNDRISSAHFAGNIKSSSELSPSYFPTIFPHSYIKKNLEQQFQDINRHNRFVKRRLNKVSLSNGPKILILNDTSRSVIVNDHQSMKQTDADVNVSIDNAVVQEIEMENLYSNQECQVEYVQNTCHTMIPNRRIMKDKSFGTSKEFIDSSTQCDLSSDECDKHFNGYSSIKTDDQLSGLAGVSKKNFEFLLSAVPVSDKYVITKENRLLIFLMKLKLGLTFPAINASFGVHRTTISRLFFSLLNHLATETKDLVYWPEKSLVQVTMPDCFKPEYSNTRVIIDCTEFRIDVPSSVDNRVFCYSHYKKSFTAKVLIGITPAGFISLKSKAAGGRKSDSQLNIDTGLVDLVEDNDIVLADKGFPAFKSKINDSGKRVLLIMPPFLEGNNEFAKEETEEIYNVARPPIIADTG
ncbi:hypothetical protein TKK_0009894 [Trichogramma kaykai]